MIRYCSIILIYICLSATKPNASISTWFNDLKGENSGHTTCNFLTLPVSAVQLARGMSSYTGVMDATDLPLYPANTALANRNKFSFTHLEWIMGLRKEYTGAIFPLRSIGTIGIYSQVFTPGAFTQARDINENPSHPEMLEFAAGATFASSLFKKKLNFGLGVSVIESRLDDVSGGAISLAAHALYMPIPNLMIQLHGANFGTEITYTSVKETLPAQAGISLKLLPIPEYFSFTSKVNFDIAAGVSKIADEPVNAGISTEISFFNYYKARIGYEFIYGTDFGLEGLGIGTGFHFGMYGVDGAWKNQSKDLGSVWAATLKLQLNEIPPRTAEDYYKAALKFYDRDRMNLSTIFAHKALRLNPSMWKAHSLLTQIRSNELRDKNLEIGLFYSGNLNGNVAIPFDPASFGGLSRITKTLNILRSQFPVFFALATGNFISINPHPIKVKLAGLALAYSDYDALICGSQELILGAEKIAKESSKKNLQFICSNGDDKAPYTKGTVIESHGYRLFVASYINGSSLPKTTKIKLQPFNESKLLTGDASSCHLRILVIDDTWDQIRAIAAKLTTFDIIICNNLDQHFPSPLQIGRVKILSAGKDGAYAGNLTMRFNDAKQLLSIENRLIPMNTQIQPDTYIDSLVRAVSAQVELSDNGIDSINISLRTTQGSFIFLSDRDSSIGIYLKNVKQMAEFPLTRSVGLDCDLPAYSFQVGKVVYRAKTADCDRIDMMEISGALNHTLKDSITLRDMSFSANGEWVYFSGAPCNKTTTDIFRVRYDGGKPLPVITWSESSEFDIDISPDNSTMTFCSDRDGTSQVYECGTDGAQPIRITDSSAVYRSPHYSPTSNYLAYLSDYGNFSGRMDLWVFDKQKGSHRQITSNSNVKNYCWLSDGTTIIYSSGVNILDLNKVEIESYRFSKVLPTVALKTYNDYSPHSIFIDGVEQIIFTREFIDKSKKIMVTSIDGSDVHGIVESKGNDWLP